MPFMQPLANRAGGYAGLDAQGNLSLPAVRDMLPSAPWNWAPGSLALYLQWDALNRIGYSTFQQTSMLLPGQTVTQNAYTSLSPGADPATTGTCVPNPKFFLNNGPAKADLSALSVQNSWQNDGRRGGTAVTPCHILGSWHFVHSVNTKLWFANSAGAMVRRTLTARAQVAGSDIFVGLLDEDLPAGFTFAKVLPPNWAAWLPSPWFTVYRRNMYNQFCIAEAAYCGIQGTISDTYQTLDNAATFPNPPVDPADIGGPYRNAASAYAFDTTPYLICRTPRLHPALTPWNITVFGYDSSGAVFFLLNNRPVLLATIHDTGDVWSSGSNALFGFNTQINAALAALGNAPGDNPLPGQSDPATDDEGRYQLTELDPATDLAGFATYS